MQCPNDQTALVMSERKGIEVDYCPTCRGVWLDRGELDKIIDRSLDEYGPAQAPPPDPAAQQPPPAAPRRPAPEPMAPPSVYPPETAYPPRRRFGFGSADSPDEYGYYGDPRYRRRRRKESFLGDLFDF
ncbi:zf-TFIIB domain-containing protein [Georgenia alba]|uniref:Zf-TFIIB domain-containing protein n=1 Tax=Georgenia alba TaxID=2233858 RepID=A0ABW2Q2L2_9MICO